MAVVVRAETLELFARRLLEAAGVPHDQAVTVARSLVEANLRGLDSHGVMRIPYYVEAIEEERIHLDAPLQIVRQGKTHLVVDAGWGLGQVQLHRLLEKLMALAVREGVAVAAVQRLGHIGRVGEYAEVAAAEGLVSLFFVNTHGAAQRVAPFGGKEPRLGTNPICIGVPTDHDPIILDFCTAATAEGKVRVKRIAGEKVPPGLLIDATGQPTTDPNVLYQEPSGAILPFGGAQGYKGFGLALMVDILAGALSGGLTAHPNPERPLGNDVFAVILDPDQFAGRDHFVAQVRQLVEYVRSCPPAREGERILLPGEPERIVFWERKEHGVPIDAGNWDALVQLARRLGVRPPEVAQQGSNG